MTLFPVVICIAAMVGGISLNDGSVYTRYQTSDCNHGILNYKVVDSTLCCDDHYHSKDWPCVAAYDSISHILSSYWCWILPLLPLCMTALRDRRNQLPIDKHFRRLYTYCIIFLYRTTERTSNCWYAHLHKSRRCKPTFDFSDHIVLYIGHYMMPIYLECAYVFSDIKQCKLKLSDYAPTLIVSSILVVLAARAMLFTTMFFHTTEENVLAICISAVLLVAPVVFSKKSVLHL